MKIKANINLSELIKYGFSTTDKVQEERDDQYDIAKSDYNCCIGAGRRGQYYYLLVNASTRNVSIYASKPDGDGCPTNVDDVFFKLILDGIVEM